MGVFKWSPVEGIDVSSHGTHPYSLFSPFSHDTANQIPVPGKETVRADSVEGIWQGLKIISCSIKPELFIGRPYKRSGRPDGHLFGDNHNLGYADARRQIYVPAYVYHAINNAIPHAWPDLERRLQEGNVVLHDVGTNGDINNLSSSLAHSAVLVQLLNVVKDAPIPKVLPTEPNPQAGQFTYLHEQVEALVQYREQLSPEDKQMLDEVITFAYLFSPDVKKQEFALSAIKSAGIKTDRARRYTPNEQTRKLYERL